MKEDIQFKKKNVTNLIFNYYFKYIAVIEWQCVSQLRTNSL